MTKMAMSDSVATQERSRESSGRGTAACCTTEVLEVCCERAEKSACCGAGPGAGCGCQGNAK